MKISIYTRVPAIMRFGRATRCAAFVAFLLAFLAGCAEKGPVLLNVNYKPTGPVVVAPKNSVVHVGPIRDSRGIAASVAGKKKIVFGRPDDITVQLPLSDLVTKMLKDSFSVRGFTVKSIMDTPEEGPTGPNLLAGGEIKTLWLESSTGPFWTTLHSTILLKIMVGNATEKKIIKTLDITTTRNRYIFYSREKLEKALSESLSSALDEVFGDEAVRKALQ